MEMRLFKQASNPVRSLAEQFPALAQCTGLLHIPAPALPALVALPVTRELDYFAFQSRQSLNVRASFAS